MLDDELLWDLAKAAANTEEGSGKLHYSCDKAWAREFARLVAVETTANNERDRLEAARYRWLRDKGSTTWTPFRQQWKMDAALCDAAVDAEMAKQTGIRAA